MALRISICQPQSKRGFVWAILLWLCLLISVFLSSCGNADLGDPELLKNIRVDLVDWHISGLGIINSPVAWVRIFNGNSIAIEDIILGYATYDYRGNKLNEGTYPLEGKVEPGRRKDFIELYLGLVDVNSEQLSVQIQSVRCAQ